MAVTLQQKAFCDIKSVAPYHYLTGLSTTSPCKLGLLTTLQKKASLLGKCSKTLPFLSDIIRSMLKDMKDNIIIHHNIPFLSDIITRSMPKVIKDNIILSALINKNSLNLASAFFAIGLGS